VAIGITEFCLQSGIKKLTWLTNQAFYNKAISVWDTRPLGLPRYYPDDDATYIAAVSDIDEKALKRQRDRLKNVRDHITYAYMPVSALGQSSLRREAA
jgi:hypothetical protein